VRARTGGAGVPRRRHALPAFEDFRTLCKGWRVREACDAHVDGGGEETARKLWEAAPLRAHGRRDLRQGGDGAVGGGKRRVGGGIYGLAGAVGSDVVSWGDSARGQRRGCRAPRGRR
jgi:hypothetical protein